MIRPIPTVIRSLHGDVIPVLQRPLSGGVKGYYDLDRAEIVIDSEQPEAAKWEVLLHELLHAIDETIERPWWLRAIWLRRLPHRWIQEGAAHLFELLAMSGALSVAAEDVEPWLREVRAPKGNP